MYVHCLHIEPLLTVFLGGFEHELDLCVSTCVQGSQRCVRFLSGTKCHLRHKTQQGLTNGYSSIPVADCETETDTHPILCMNYCVNFSVKAITKNGYTTHLLCSCRKRHEYKRLWRFRFHSFGSFTLQETDSGTESASDPIPVVGSKDEIWIWFCAVRKFLHSAM